MSRNQLETNELYKDEREDKGSEPRVPRLRRLGGRLAVERVHLVAVRVVLEGVPRRRRADATMALQRRRSAATLKKRRKTM